MVKKNTLITIYCGLGEQLPGGGGSQASIIHAKVHSVGIKLQKTPRDGAEHGEGEAQEQETVEEEHSATTRDRQGTGPPVEEGRGGEQV